MFQMDVNVNGNSTYKSGSHSMMVSIVRKSVPVDGPVQAEIAENLTDTGEVFDLRLNPTIPAAASTGNEDRALFEIDDTTGELKFKAAPDFEAKGSAAGDNEYKVLVEQTPSGGGATVSASVTVTVTDAGLIYSVPEGLKIEDSNNTADAVGDMVFTMWLTNAVEVTRPLHVSLDYSYTVTAATYPGGNPAPAAGDVKDFAVVADGDVEPAVVVLTHFTTGNTSDGDKLMTYKGTVALTSAVTWPEPPYATEANDTDRGKGWGTVVLTVTPSDSSSIELKGASATGNNEIYAAPRMTMSGFDYAGSRPSVWAGTGDSSLALTGTVTPPKGVHKMTDATALNQYFTQSRGRTVSGSVTVIHWPRRQHL